MAIVSVSLNRKNLEDIGKIKAALGYTGTSEVFRAALLALSHEAGDTASITGMMRGIVSLVHRESDERAFIEAKHDFDSIIETQLHSKLGESKCLEVLIVKGDGKRIREFLNFLRAKKMESVKLTVV